MNIKPIETYYDGYRFRSRLEARWAVFFNAQKIRYEYEPEGFRLRDGSKYLPDFYLPDFCMYVEVKSEEAFKIVQSKNDCISFESNREKCDRYAVFSHDFGRSWICYMVCVRRPSSLFIRKRQISRRTWKR